MVTPTFMQISPFSLPFSLPPLKTRGALLARNPAGGPVFQCSGLASPFFCVTIAAETGALVSAEPEIAIQVTGLTRKYKSVVAVEDLSLCVHKGDIYGFLGPNGAGKTTAMRMILGLIRRDSGHIELLGNTNLTAARQHIGAIVETPGFHGWTSATRNLQYACAYANLPKATWTQEIARVLELVGLTDRAKDTVKTYSLGMKQRLAIARALLGNPQLLFLDEPTNGLDPKGMAEVRELIRSLALNEQLTVFISSHLLAEVQAICNRVGIIQKGRLRAEGYVDELLKAHSNETSVEVGAENPAKLEEVLQSTEGIKVRGAGEAGRILVQLESATIASLNRTLVESGIHVTALVPNTTNLEDVFMEVTR
jgi:ABC-2 type transport system ATP-binding protein